MAKRPAEVYITDQNPGGDDNNGSSGATSTPQKAPTAQLAKRRILQPRGGRRPAATGARRPAPSSSALNHQQENSDFNQTNGAQQPLFGGGGAFSFGQAAASASFPPFPSTNNTGNSSTFNPPSSSFSFGSQISFNPFTPTATFGGNNENDKSDQSTAQVQYSPSNNLFLQPTSVIQAEVTSAGLSPSVTAPLLGTYSGSGPPTDYMARKRAASEEPENEGYPVKAGASGRLSGPKQAEWASMPPPPVPTKGQPMTFHNTAPPSKPGTYGSANRTVKPSPQSVPVQGQPMVFTNTAPSSKPGTYGSANRTFKPSPLSTPPQGQPFVFHDTAPSSKSGTFGTAGRTMAPPGPRLHLNPPKDPNAHLLHPKDHHADDMDIEATSAAIVPSAPAPQNLFSGFGGGSVSTANVFGNGNNSQVPQGQNLDFPSPLTLGFAPSTPSAPSQTSDEMELDPHEALTPSEAFTPFEDSNSFGASFPWEDNMAWTNDMIDFTKWIEEANMMHTGAIAAPEPAHNAFQSQGPSQNTSNMFANLGNPSSSGFSFGQQESSTNSQQNSFNFGQQATSAASQPQTTQTPPIDWSQVFPSASTQPQTDPTPAYAFSRSSAATKGLETSDSDAMMISPEKRPLGRSLFDRVEQPPVDASSSPVTTSTAAPPAFSLGHNTSLQAGLFQNNPPVQTVPTSNASSGQNDLFGRITAPPSFGQNASGEAAQSTDSLRASSPAKESRPIAEPEKHIEDRPTPNNPFGGIFLSKEQSSITAPSPFAPKPQANIASTSDMQSSGALFGSSTINQQNSTSPFTTLDQKSASPSTSNLFQLSNASQATGQQAGSNLFEVQAQATNKSAPLGHVKPSSGESPSKDTRGPLRQSSTAQNNGGQHAGVPSKSANPAADVKEHNKTSRRQRNQPLEPPPHWTAEEKEQYYIAYKLKQLDVGAEAKRKTLLAARDMHGLKHLKQYYRETVRSIKAGHHDPFRPVSPSSNANEVEQNENDSASPSNSQGSHGRANNASPKRKMDDRTGHQQGHRPNESSKRARVTESDQVSYPTLTTPEPSSNTSSMFKNILDKPAAAINGESNTGLSLSFSKSSESNSSVLPQSSSNIFANSSMKMQAGGATTEPAKPASSPFVFKATTSSSSNSTASSNSGFKMQNFGSTSGPTNFLAQFGQISAADSKKEMEKRKAEDMDSDEDEAEWERRDAEEQRAKKQKTEQEASKLKPKYVAGKGFVFETNESENGEPAAAEAASEAPPLTPPMSELDKQHESFAKQQVSAAKFGNPFAKFGKQDSGNEGSKNGDADDEGEGSDEEEQPSKKSTGGSLFDRISAPSSKANDDAHKDHPLNASSQGINMFGHLSGAAASVPRSNATNQAASPAKANPFGLLSSSATQNVFGTPPSARAPNAPGSGEKGDNTWKLESQIKFGFNPDAGNKKRDREDDNTEEGQGSPKRADNKDAPIFNFTSPSPSKTPLGSLFGAAKPNATMETPSKSIFDQTASTPASSAASNFGFGISPIKPAPALGSLFPPSNNASLGASRSNSPGATTGESATESNADGDDEGAEKHEQLNLTSGGPGEENEDVLYEVRAKASIWDDTKDNAETGKKGDWEIKGLGPFRIMKNRETGKARMLMRSDPAGRIIINSSISNQFKIDTPTKQLLRIPMLSPNQKIETWAVRVGKGVDTTDIKQILNENKNSN